MWMGVVAVRQAVRSCESCRGTGWVIVQLEKVERVEVCSNCRSELRPESRLQRASIPSRYHQQSFATFEKHTPSQGQALLSAIDFTEAFPDVELGMLFHGSCGVGKTHLSVAIIKGILAEKNVTARFVDEAELLRRLQYTYGQDSAETEQDVLQPLRRAELLVWDDLGTGRPTDWVRETIHMIINYRYTNRLLTVFSTNLPLKAEIGASRTPARHTLSERIGERLYSRILEMCEIVNIEGQDYRKTVLKDGMDFVRSEVKRK